MEEDRIFLPGPGAPPIALERFLVRHADVDDHRAPENFVGQVRECFGEAIRAAAREFDEDGMRAQKIVVLRYVFFEREIDFADEKIPSEWVFEKEFRIAKCPLAAQTFPNQIVLEDLPDPDEIVNLDEWRDVEPGAARTSATS